MPTSYHQHRGTSLAAGASQLCPSHHYSWNNVSFLPSCPHCSLTRMSSPFPMPQETPSTLKDCVAISSPFKEDFYFCLIPEYACVCDGGSICVSLGVAILLAALPHSASPYVSVDPVDLVTRGLLRADTGRCSRMIIYLNVLSNQIWFWCKGKRYKAALVEDPCPVPNTQSSS